MQPGVAALAARPPCLLIDFEGLREYSAKALAACVAARWPGLRTLRLAFPAPGIAGEVYAAHIALALEELGPAYRFETRITSAMRAPWACRRFSESSVAPAPPRT